ncbi:MAG: DEAD/DEAH box helicase [Bacteroidetes bacterium]|nr:DEAD/DEAH box helicase [Bacteroidota bacterium]HET6242916.1 DEAD/DEAH box helicase [Bacteroidia bacterium]
MKTFENLNLSKELHQAIEDLGFDTLTPIQEQAYPVILSNKDIVGIAQTGTGKTFAYMLPILHQMKYSKEVNPRVLILLPTRELVMQVVENINSYAKYKSVRVLGIFGETNINVQKKAIAQGLDILVATPGRLYDLVLSGSLSFKSIKKLVIDEVDIMLDNGFRPQLINIFELLPAKRQNIMFSATMTSDVAAIIEDFFIAPFQISIVPSGARLNNISQQCYPVKNFLTKVNLLKHLLKGKEYQKVLVFVTGKKIADRLFDCLEKSNVSLVGIIHSNKSQNYRIRSIEEFESGAKRVLIATEVIARGIDFDKISHVINFDVPEFPENYMHRIGRTGRAEQHGNSILFYTQQEEKAKQAIESLMSYQIPITDFPSEVAISDELIPEEKPKVFVKNYLPEIKKKTSGLSFHEKSDKNKKVNVRGAHKKKAAAKYKKPIRKRGDKK